MHVFEILTHTARNSLVFPTPPVWHSRSGAPVRISGWNLLRENYRGNTQGYGMVENGNFIILNFRPNHF